MIQGQIKPFKFNYWQWFKVCVNELKMQPSEAWALDFVEIYHLFDLGSKSDIDISLMLNFERIQNGASREWLQKPSSLS